MNGSEHSALQHSRVCATL